MTRPRWSETESGRGWAAPDTAAPRRSDSFTGWSGSWQPSPSAAGSPWASASYAHTQSAVYPYSRSHGIVPRFWAAVAHLTIFIGIIATAGLVAFLGPLVVWMLRRDADAFSATHARNALNFVLSLLTYTIGFSVVGVLMLISGLTENNATSIITGPIMAGAVFVLAVGSALVLSIIAAFRAFDDRPWRYPLTIPFIR